MFLCAWFYSKCLTYTISLSPHNFSMKKETITAIIIILQWENQGTEFLTGPRQVTQLIHSKAWLTNIPFPYLHWYWGNCQAISDNYLTHRRTSVLVQFPHYWQQCTHRRLRQTEWPLQYPRSRWRILWGKKIEPCLVTTKTRPGWKQWFHYLSIHSSE